jgi:hypothetical protein
MALDEMKPILKAWVQVRFLAGESWEKLEARVPQDYPPQYIKYARQCYEELVIQKMARYVLQVPGSVVDDDLLLTERDQTQAEFEGGMLFRMKLPLDLVLSDDVLKDDVDIANHSPEYYQLYREVAQKSYAAAAAAKSGGQ